MTRLLPAENLALTVARAQLQRGENPPINTTAALVLALDRLTGWDDGAETQRAASACSESRPGVGADPDRTGSGD